MQWTKTDDNEYVSGSYVITRTYYYPEWWWLAKKLDGNYYDEVASGDLEYCISECERHNKMQLEPK